MKLEDLKVGSYLWLSDIKNPECADYGPLLVTKITRKTVKFDTNWYGNKPHYINRDEVRVVFTNYSGKKVEGAWWADEWEKDACDFFKRIILLKATNNEDAFEEFRVLRAERDAKEAADYTECGGVANSVEAFFENCEKNHYEFSATKTTPLELEHMHNTNYQF